MNPSFFRDDDSDEARASCGAARPAVAVVVVVIPLPHLEARACVVVHKRPKTEENGVAEMK